MVIVPIVANKIWNCFVKHRLKLLIPILLFICGNEVMSQNIVSGVVVNNEGLPIPNVSVTIKGTTKGGITSADGQFNISASSSSTLVFTCVGYKPVEINAGNRSNITVTMETLVIGSGEDVVVIGYGKIKKKDLTGSVGVVNMEDLKKAPVPSFIEALAGRVSGVQVTSSDGQPGAGYSITIRGPGSLTQSTAPLFVIDGVPTENVEPATLNIEEIENMTVLKDASATAIYGSRAANGVILITTKRGKQSRPIVSFTTQYSVQAKPKKMELMSPYEFVKYQLELNPTDRTALSYLGGGKTLDSYKDSVGLDLQDYLFQKGNMQTYDLALRGGSENTRYSISGGYMNQVGAIINTGYKRYSGRVTLDQTISKVFSTGITVNYSNVTQSGQIVNIGQVAQNNPTSFILATAWMYRPISPFVNDNLLLDDADDNAVTSSDARINPYISQKNQYNYSYTKLLETNGYLNINILKGLSFKSTVGIRQNYFRNNYFNNSKTAQASPFNLNNVNGIHGGTSNIRTDVFINSNILNYNKVFAAKHNLSALALMEVSTQKTSSDGYMGRLLPNESLGIDGIDEGLVANQISNNTKNAVVSYATRWDYSYDSRYLATFTFRADGSSKFINSKWGYFPSAALAWNMHNEKFIKGHNSIVSTSKIKIGYGTTGNNRVGDYAAYPSLIYDNANNGYPLNNTAGVGGVYVNNIGNPDLKWETTKTIDLGYELGLFKDRIQLEVDLYRRTTSDLLLSAPLPTSTGFASAVKNIGELRNDGLEITLNTININKKSFKWQTSFNISFNKNIIMALADGQQALSTVASYVSQFGNALYLAQIGRASGMMIGYIWAGNYQYEDFENPAPGVYVLKANVAGNGSTRSTIQPGDIKYVDIDGDGTMTTADVSFIGRGQPKNYGGLSNNFMYKGFSLNVFFQWVYGNNIYNANRLLLEGNSNGYASINQFKSYANRWSPDNPTNDNYRTRGQGPIGFHSSRVVEDGSFLRLKTINLGYNLPAKHLSKIYMSGLTVFASAQNLITWTKYTGLDPEVSTRNNLLTPGYDYSSYPKSPMFAIGIKGTF